MASWIDSWRYRALDEEELNQLHEIANDSSRNIRGAYLFFLLLMLYLLILIGSIGDQDLLTKADVSLPLLTVEIPVVGFFAIGPWLLVLFHANLLSQFYLLSRKLFALESRVRGRANEAKEDLHLDLLVFPLVLNYSVLGFSKSKGIQRAFGVATWATIVAVPILVLLFALVSIVRYQDDYLSLSCSLAVMLDLIICAVFWPMIIWGDITWRERLRKRFAAIAFAGSFSIFVIYFALLDAVPPDGIVERSFSFAMIDLRSGDDREQAASGHCSEKSHKRSGFTRWGLLDWGFRRYIEIEKSVSAQADQRDPTTGLNPPILVQRPRANLRHATLNSVNMPEADLRKADLSHACVVRSNLHRAQLSEANLASARFRRTDLSGAQLVAVSAPAANFRKATLIGANFACRDSKTDDNKTCEGSELSDLTDANLIKADLSAANLSDARLEGADLEQADLTAAILQSADLTDTNLHAVILEMADLRGAEFAPKDLSAANLRRSDLRELKSNHGKNSWLSAIGQLRTKKHHLPEAEVQRRAKDLLDGSIGSRNLATGYEENSIDAYFDALLPLLIDTACRGSSYAEGIARRYAALSDGIELCRLAYGFGKRCKRKWRQPKGTRPIDLLTPETKGEIDVQARVNALGDPTARCRISRKFLNESETTRRP